MTRPSAYGRLDRLRRARAAPNGVVTIGGHTIPGPVLGLAMFAVLAVAIQLGATFVLDPLIHRALLPQRVPVSAVQVEPMFVFMDQLGVLSYGTIHFCDYVIDARGTFVSDLNADGCDGFQVAPDVAHAFDAEAVGERTTLLADERRLGLPSLHAISLSFDDNHRLVDARFAVDSCVTYDFQPAQPLDLRDFSPADRGPSPWTTTDGCSSA